MPEKEFPIIQTSHGLVKGRSCTSLYGDNFCSFEGIPFAKPPLGNLRFKAAQPPEPWKGLLECLTCKAIPFQLNSATQEFEGSEDCLYLNVYSKHLKSEKPLPVLFYIFGGGFQTGGANRESFGPDYFMKEDVVLVTFNYRLGPFGFMSFKEESLDIPGNAGLKDQVAALKWFKENAPNFNADPDNITAFGHSAGGIAVHYLTIADKTKDLFHKAILQSGCAYNSDIFGPIDDYPYRLAQKNGFTGSSTDEKGIFDVLCLLEAKDLLSNILTDEEKSQGTLYSFHPSPEPYETDQGLFYKHPRELVAHSWGHKIPIMLGTTTDEGLLFYKLFLNQPELMGAIKTTPELILPKELRQMFSKEEALRWSSDIISRFLNNNLEKENLLKYIKLISLKIFLYYNFRTCLIRLKYCPKIPTFVYRFAFDSPSFNLYRNRFCEPGMRGVPHADELSYLFRMKESYKLESNSKEYHTMRRLVRMWCAFAKNSDPNCSDIAPAIWSPLREETPLKCFCIDDQLEMIDFPELEDLEYWHTLYEKIKL